MKIVFFESYPEGKCCVDLASKLGAKYYNTPTSWRGNQKDFYKDVDSSDLLVIWSALEAGSDWARRVSENLQTPYLYMERGFVPQKGYYSLDVSGNIKSSSLNNSLDWLTPELENRSEKYCKSFFRAKGWRDKGEEYILCPLQLEWDTSVYLCSPYRNMEYFLLDVIDNFPKEKILVTPHPLYRDFVIKNKIVRERVQMVKNKSTMDLAQRAKLVVGINSTVLYEVLAFGKKVIAFGDCPIKTHNGDRRVALAAIQRQFSQHDEVGFMNLAKYLLSQKGN